MQLNGFFLKKISCCLQEIHFRSKDTHRGDGKRYSAQMEIKKKAGVVILTSDKVDFKMKTVTRDKGHYITIMR